MLLVPSPPQVFNVIGRTPAALPDSERAAAAGAPAKAIMQKVLLASPGSLAATWLCGASDFPRLVRTLYC